MIRQARATALVDGDNGLGSLVVSRAVEEAIALARDNGVGWVGVRHGNHAGAAAVYAAMPVAHDMIGLYFAVGNANHLPPWGGTDMLLSTNPIAIAVPALEEPPLVLDMATTVAAYGKVKVAAQQGKTMPEGWMIDRRGQTLTDPNRADDGFLLPIGGYKGAALALMFGLLAGTLNGAANGEDVVDFNKDDSTPTNTGQAICVIDIKAFAEPVAFKRQVDSVIRQLHGSALLPGFDRIRLPGEDRHSPHRRAPGNRHPDPAFPQRRPRPHGGGTLDPEATGLNREMAPRPPAPLYHSAVRPAQRTTGRGAQRFRPTSSRTAPAAISSVFRGYTAADQQNSPAANLPAQCAAVRLYDRAPSM